MSLVNAETGELLAEMTPDEARSLTDRIKTALGVSWELITDAYQRRAWAALGFASWDAYCSAEFGAYRLKLPAEDRQEVVASLRESGMSIRAIASATGMARNTVRNDLQVGQSDPPHALPPAVDPEASSSVDPAGEGQEGPGASPQRPAPAVDKKDEPMDGKKITGTDGKSYANSDVGRKERRDKFVQMAAEGYTSRQIAAALGFQRVDSLTIFRKRNGLAVPPADAVVGQTRNLDSNRIVAETVGALEGLSMGVDLIGDPATAGLDPDQIEGWVTSLRASLTVLTRFSKQLKEMTQ